MMIQKRRVYRHMGFKEIGRKIQKAREESGMTQVDLSRALGITQAALSNYELGKRRLYLHQIEQIASLLGKTLDFFITEEHTASEPALQGRAVREKDVLLARVSRLHSSELSALADYLDFLEWRRSHVADD
jgi:transcriptional regulator with XRE-family HTH domain